jgi:hypothetical protein
MEAAEVWSASGSDPLSAFTSPRALRRNFDAGVKGYVAELPAGGPPRPSLPGARARRWARSRALLPFSRQRR